MNKDTPTKITSSREDPSIAGLLQIVKQLLEIAVQLRNDDLEKLCRRALGIEVPFPLDKNNSVISLPRKNFVSFITSIGIDVGFATHTNHSVRFRRVGENTRKNPFTTAVFGNSGYREYEDVTSQEVLNAPICDIFILQRGDILPQGYYRISLTPTGRGANLNAGSGGNQLFVCIKKDITGESTPITALSILFPSKGEYLLPGYSFVKRQQIACDLNFGSNAERIYLSYKKEKYGNPIFDIQPFFPGRGEQLPRNFFVVERTQRNFDADLNSGTASHRILLAYRQHLRKLDCMSNTTRYSQQSPSSERSASVRLSRISISPSSMHLPASLPINHNTQVTRSRSQSCTAAITPPSRLQVDCKTPPPPPPLALTSTISKSVENGRESGQGSSVNGSELRTSEVREIVDGFFMGTFAAGAGEAEDPVDEIDASGVVLSLEDPRVDESILPISDRQESTFTPSVRSESPTPSVDHNYYPIADRYTDVVVTAEGQVIDESVRKVLHPVLVAIYVRSATAYECALSGLQHLLESSSFFATHLQELAPYGCKALLDIIVDTVCDRFDAFVDTQSEYLLMFLKSAITISKGQLSVFTLQRIFRTLTLICACYATDPFWLSFRLSDMNTPLTKDKHQVVAYKVLCTLIRSISDQADASDVVVSLPRERTQHSLGTLASNPSSQTLLEGLDDDTFFINDLVLELVAEIIDNVETALLCDRIQLHIRKASSTTSSSAFWEELSSFSRKLFRDHAYQCYFVILCALCKISILEVRYNNNGDPVPRDLGNKLFALDALRELLSCAGENLKQSKTVGYLIRRIVVPCLIRNTEFSLREARVFSLLLKNMTALWRHWRTSVKMEFAILCDQLVFRVLQESATKAMFLHQTLVLDEIVLWFEVSHALFEMFVNYDFDRDLIVHWDVFEKLTRAVCALASSGMSMKVQKLSSNDHNHLNQGHHDHHHHQQHHHHHPFQELVTKALDVILHIAKGLMDAAGHAHLIVADESMQTKSICEGGGWDVQVDESEDIHEDKQGLPKAPESKSPLRLISNSLQATKSVRHRHDKHVNSAKLMNRATSIYHEKGLLKAVKFLTVENFMNDTPQEVASFLRLYKDQFDPSAIGDMLGEGGRTSAEEYYWDQVRYRYTRATSFTDMTVEQALRKFLTSCGFRLPGEAQKIDRFVEAFVKVFWQDNRGTPFAPFKHEDTVHLCVYAIIMLNTDLHRATRDKRRGAMKMTKEQFVVNLRGADKDKNNPLDTPSDINREYLTVIYDTIAKHPIEMAVESSEAKERDGEQVSRFDKAEFTANIVKGLHSSEDSLRSLSKTIHKFVCTGVDLNISLDMIRYMFENVWHHFHKVTDVLVNSTIREPAITHAALDLLKYALSCCIFLGSDVKLERDIFATQLAKFKMWLETYKNALSSTANHTTSALDVLINHKTSHKQVHSATFAQGTYVHENWFKSISSVTPDNAMEVVQEVLVLVHEVKETFSRLAALEELRNAVAKIDKRAHILRNNTSFIREGDLAKFNRKGKMITYHFFLFSDTLLYAHHEYLGGYKVHTQMDLRSMSVHDVDDDRSGCCMSLTHPTKSFIVAAETPALRQAWMRDISSAIISIASSRLDGRSPDITMKTTGSPDVDSIGRRGGIQRVTESRFFSSDTGSDVDLDQSEGFLDWTDTGPNKLDYDSMNPHKSLDDEIPDIDVTIGPDVIPSNSTFCLSVLRDKEVEAGLDSDSDSAQSPQSSILDHTTEFGHIFIEPTSFNSGNDQITSYTQGKPSSYIDSMDLSSLPESIAGIDASESSEQPSADADADADDADGNVRVDIDEL